MSIRKRIVSVVGAAALASGVLVGTSPAAQAAVGDTTSYLLGSGGNNTDLEDIVVGPDGLLWAWDDSEDVFLKINASGEVQGVVPGSLCASSAFKISFAGSL